MTSLLPHNAAPAERAMEAATDRPVPVVVGDLWDPQTCPAALLPWLAWAMSVDDWDPGWPEAARRAAIASSAGIHRHKGTVWAMRRALEVADLGGADIQEGFSANLFDGSFTCDGSRDHHSSDHWAEYRVTLTRPLSIAQSQQARSILTAAAPARCHLKFMTFETAAHLHNGAITYDGQYTHGVI